MIARARCRVTVGQSRSFETRGKTQLSSRKMLQVPCYWRLGGSGRDISWAFIKKGTRRPILRTSDVEVSAYISEHEFLMPVQQAETHSGHIGAGVIMVIWWILLIMPAQSPSVSHRQKKSGVMHFWWIFLRFCGIGLRFHMQYLSPTFSLFSFCCLYSYVQCNIFFYHSQWFSQSYYKYVIFLES